jgi:HEAT repeat protein
MNVKDYRLQVEAQLGAAGSPDNASVASTVAPPEQHWADAIRQLADPTLPAEARKNAAQVLQAGTFLGAQFGPFRADYLVALRTAATDADPDLRRSALDTLVNLDDEFAREVLTDGLRGIGKALVPQAAALGMLARNDHNSATAIARDLLAGGADVATRAQAVRVLGSDPASSDLLAEIMKNKSEFREVRRASAVALKGLDPQAFQAGAIDILRDVNDFEDIQATVGGALERSGISLGKPPLKAQ